MVSSGDKFVYFLIGGFVGATVALLFAPKSGVETRNFLEDKYKQGTDRLTQKMREGAESVSGKSRKAAERVTESVDKGVATLTNQKEKFTAAVEAGKKAYLEEKEKLDSEEDGSTENPAS